LLSNTELLAELGFEIDEFGDNTILLRQIPMDLSPDSAAEAAEALAADRNIDLEAKRKELDGIEAETAKEVEALNAQQAKAQAVIDDRLLTAYNRIRSNVHNGLAVVTIKRDACGGCYNRIPPQRQVEVRQGKKIIVCEYCGRILVAEPEE
jgi:predicted  nucleic acid-binding Zn-ribbon protein